MLENPDEFTYAVADDFAELVASLPERGRVLVDMPIGLRSKEHRERGCESAARAVLGPRRSSVFAPPMRAVLTCETYEQANLRERELCGKGLSRQTFGIVPKMAQVDALMRTDAKARRLVREAHPEVCFWALAGGQPLHHAKKTDAGFAQRLALLKGVWGRAEEAIAHAYLWTRRAEVARDDIVDALVLAVTASLPDEALRTFPERPSVDDFGLPMEMVYGVVNP
ncbi:MAG: putative RNase H-like nuclease [Gammaproteobacteria bacterium]